ncbi:MAG: hypothetical protein KDD60_08815, partial [Bdellovibrionales bacterium]|nr:hypothetical protein [Bdellovibrionales bacterium]
AFAVGSLGYSESAACRRVYAARSMREHSELALAYEAGQISLKAISAAAKPLREKESVEEQKRLVSELIAAHTTAHPGKEVERVLARENPQSRKREIVRPIVIKKEVAEAPLFSNKSLESTPPPVANATSRGS